MAKITLKDIIAGQKTKTVGSYNTDLFKSDNENLTESFNKNDYDFITLISTDTDTKSGLLKESIIAISGGDSYLLNTSPTAYNGEVNISIFSKWLTLQGFNYFTKENDNFLDTEGKIIQEVKNYYNEVLLENNLDITYDDILELGEFNSEYNCIILSFVTDDFNYYITINSHQQLSKITKKVNMTKPNHSNVKTTKIKSILG
jgi:hypothetical protein